jgi:CheY-like chemotaxis protein
MKAITLNKKTMKKKTILIVDDDMDYLFQMKLKVEQFGYETITADSQKEAEMIIESVKPDLAILDLMMESDDSGFILAYRIKRKYPDVPIIIATAVTAETGMSFDINSDDSQQWIKADLFLDKGIRTDQLQREINKLLKI